jgi:hypothetical protein
LKRRVITAFLSLLFVQCAAVHLARTAFHDERGPAEAP